MLEINKWTTTCAVKQNKSKRIKVLTSDNKEREESITVNIKCIQPLDTLLDMSTTVTTSR